MTITSNRPARRGGSAPQFPDGALLRFLLHDRDGLAGLPPAPEGRDVSVSFSSSRAATTAAVALHALGYRTVGVVSLGDAEPDDPAQVADFLVPQGVIEQYPDWWRTLVRRADHAFNLAAGPVQTALAAVVRTHREPLR